MLGAATGPGSSTQFLAADVVAPTWQVGLFASRVRTENDALYRRPLANFWRHDVSVGGGVRGGVRLRGLDVAAELSLADRLNYLFQNGTNNPTGVRTVDVHNVSAMLTLTPR
jgi:hypothetical protein